MEEKTQAKVVDLVARLVERGDTERAELVAEVARRREAGEDPATTQEGFDFRRFAIDFAQRYPGYTAFAPVAAGMYVYLLLDLIFGG